MLRVCFMHEVFVARLRIVVSDRVKAKVSLDGYLGRKQAEAVLVELDALRDRLRDPSDRFEAAVEIRQLSAL